MPDDVYDSLQSHSESLDTTVNQLIRQFLKLGLIVLELEDNDDKKLMIRTTEKGKEIDEVLKLVF
jgi:hypothetical protein